MAKIFIPDKKLYAAVMFVRKILQNDTEKTFETACKISASYYRLPFDEVFETAEKYQNALAPTKGKTFKYFTCYESVDNPSHFVYPVTWTAPHVCRAIDIDHCRKVIYWIEHLGGDIPVCRVPMKEYATKAIAEENLDADWAMVKSEFHKIYGTFDLSEVINRQ